MIKHLFCLKIVAAVAIVAFISCASDPGTPAPQDPGQPQPAPAAQPLAPTAISPALQDELNSAEARADEARVRAEAFEGASYFPGEWEAAEQQFAQAEQMPRNNDADARRAIEIFNAATSSFDAIFTMAIPLLAQAMEDDIMELRDRLIYAGAKDASPDFFVPADTTAVLALEQYEGGDYYQAKEAANQALLMFRTLSAAFEAWHIRGEIIDRDFRLYDLDHFEMAEELLFNAIEAYEAGNIPRALDNAEISLLRYSLVLSTAWAGYAEFRSQLVESERLAALDRRANIAAREYFMIAETDRTQAKALHASELYAEASRLFMNAEAKYIIASMTASERRQQASEVLREANRIIDESERIAQEAEIILEGDTQ